MRTLVLDQGYQPHRIVSWQRAVLMLFDGKVEVIEVYDDDIRSVTFVIKMPAVVRLLRALRGKRGVKFSRMNVAIRDGFKCQYCARKLPLGLLARRARGRLEHIRVCLSSMLVRRCTARSA